jgi:hypothetical protein
MLEAAAAGTGPARLTKVAARRAATSRSERIIRLPLFS